MKREYSNEISPTELKTNTVSEAVNKETRVDLVIVASVKCRRHAHRPN